MSPREPDPNQVQERARELEQTRNQAIMSDHTYRLLKAMGRSDADASREAKQNPYGMGGYEPC